jgi:iron-sulfur cluster assembly accessory protein
MDITLSENLAKRVRDLQVAQERPEMMLRVAVLGGGCSGFQYQFTFAEGLESGDLVFERDGVKVVVDEMSLQYLDGSTIDYAEDLIGASFQVHNPNATSACGCGTSFSM